MNKYLPFIVIGTFILISGLFLYSNKVVNLKHENMNIKPIDQSHRSYEMELIQKPSADQIVLNQPFAIKYRIKNDKGGIVKDFDFFHNKLMHFIVIRKDLMQFQHLHPNFDKNTGEFGVDVVLTVDGPYRIFADFTPNNDNPQKLPITVFNDLNVGDVSNFQPHAVIPDPREEVIVPPDYQVSYSFPTDLKSQTPITFSLLIEQNDQPVILEKYLGALGHSVILKEGSLNYIHTHAGEQNETGPTDHSNHTIDTVQENNKIDFSTAFPETGIYKIFTEFQHQGKVNTSEYVIEVSI